MLNGVDSFCPLIDPAIWRLRPDYTALSILVRCGRNGPSSEQQHPAGERAVQFSSPQWTNTHLEAWRDTYRAFGAKPQRTPCSAEALLRRVERDGTLPRINAIVDLYNTLSVQYVLPIGGEDLAAYVGRPRLIRATGTEQFDTTRDGQSCVETVDRGEVVWRDDIGVTCRRWNWRQSTRTRLTVDTTEMWFILERLEPMPLPALHEAGEALVHGVRHHAPTAEISVTLIEQSEQRPI